LQQGCNANAKAGVNWYCGLHTALVHLFVGILLLSICGVRTNSTTIIGQLILINGIVGFTRQCYTSFLASSSSPPVRYFFFYTALVHLRVGIVLLSICGVRMYLAPHMHVSSSSYMHVSLLL
jgi:hypothetical protein